MLIRIAKLVALLFVFAIFTPPDSHAQNPRKIIEKEDTNGDNKISREEFQGRAANFDKIDKNGDGYLTAKEFKVFFASRKGGGRKKGGGDKASGGKVPERKASGPAKMAGYTGRIINTHGQYEHNMEADEIVAILKRATISKAILSARPKRTNKEILAAAEKYPDMIFPSARTKYGYYLKGSKKWGEYLKGISGNSQFVGLQELLLYHAEKITPSGQKLAPEMIVDTGSAQIRDAVSLSVKRKWPVVLHYEFAVIDAPRKQRIMNAMEALLKKHPNHPFALMHMGLLNLDEVKRLIAAHKNVYFQVSMAANVYRDTEFPWTFMFKENGEVGELLPEWKKTLTAHADRFLFAMDGVTPQQWRKRSVADVQEWRAALASIPKKAADLIAHKNAERLWRGLNR